MRQRNDRVPGTKPFLIPRRFIMKLSFRWYGDDDKVTLKQIRQIPGMHSIVTAVRRPGRRNMEPGEHREAEKGN